MILFGQATCNLGEVFRCTECESFAVGDTGASNDPLTHKIRGLNCNERRDEAAHGEAEAIDLLNLEGSDHGDDVFGPVDKAGTNGAFAATDTRVINEKDGTFCGEWVNECRIPPVHIASEVDVKEEGDATLLSEKTVSILGSVDGDVTVLCCFVSRHVGCSLERSWVYLCDEMITGLFEGFKVNTVPVGNPTFILYV